MNYLSVCSGIEAATVAWHNLGWKPVGFSEIEKFPSEVLAHHYPEVTNFGDMTKYKEWKLDDTVGLLVGGTPCQSFSVAGLRKGLEDPRGNLALTYCGILDNLRPKWFVWENVQGVLSSNGGRDFGSFLGALGQLGYGFGYRVLDAQYFGVAQRRKRVFVVGCLGSWESAAKVLFEPDCLRGDLKTIGKTRQDITAGPDECFDGNNSKIVAFENSRRDGVRLFNNVSNTLQSFMGTGGGNTPCVAIQGNLIGRDAGGPNGVGVSDSNTMYTLTKTDVHAVFCDTYNGTIQGDIAATMTADMAGPTHSGPKVMQNMAVRRLTEIECERLQGFPDNYTNIRENCPSGARYKALGNSMAVPVMRWIGERINQFEEQL